MYNILILANSEVKCFGYRRSKVKLKNNYKFLFTIFYVLTVICACLLAFQRHIVCFSSFNNSRVTCINVGVSMQLRFQV